MPFGFGKKKSEKPGAKAKSEAKAASEPESAPEVKADLAAKVERASLPLQGDAAALPPPAEPPPVELVRQASLASLASQFQAGAEGNSETRPAGSAATKASGIVKANADPTISGQHGQPEETDEETGGNEGEQDDEELSEELSEEEDAAVSNDQPTVLISTLIRAGDFSAAKAVKLNLGSLAEVEELLAGAIESTPGIQEVRTGVPIEAVADISSPRRAKGRMTLIEEQLAALTQGSFVPVAAGPAEREAFAERQLAAISSKGGPGASTSLERVAAKQGEEVPEKDAFYRKDFVSGIFTQAMSSAVQRLNVEANRKPIRFVVTIVATENVDKIKKAKLNATSELYCTCAVAGRPKTLVQTCAVQMSEDVGADGRWQFELHIAEDEALDFSLFAKTSPGEGKGLLGKAVLKAMEFYEKEGYEAALTLENKGKNTGATLQIDIESMRAEDAEREAAAIKIQSIQRQRQAKNEVQQKKKENDAAVKIQSRQRGKKDREVVLKMKEDKQTELEDQAARKIQAAERARQERIERAQQERRAAIILQKAERGRVARRQVAQKRKEREKELLDDIAMISDGPLEQQKKKQWNRAAWNDGGAPVDILDFERDSLVSPYGTGLDWSAVGYRAPTASSPPAKRMLKVKEKQLPGTATEIRSELAQFKAELLRREQSLAGAWRTCLDREWQGHLAIHEFCEATRKMGYRGQLKNIWHDMDVDGNGLISLTELDWEEARDLGDFHAKLVKQFGSGAAAAKYWGLQGPRRIKMDEFFDLLDRNGMVRTASEAERLWRMMCVVPVGTESAGFLGRLGKLKDSACAVTGREFHWLDAMSPWLPHVTEDRVQPGEMDNFNVGGATGSRDAGLTKKGSNFDQDAFFENMYKEAVEHHKRLKELANPVKPPEKGIADPNLFKRLHNDHAVHLEKRRALQEKGQEERLKEANWSLSSNGKSNPEVRNRILAPRRKFAEFNFDCVAKREHLWSLLTIDQLMAECDKLVEQIQRQDPDDQEVSGWKSMGKTRKELTNLLETRTARKDKSVVAQGPVPECVDRLFDDFEGRDKRLTELQTNALEQERKDFLNDLCCPVHGKALEGEEPECRMCRRFLAMREDRKLEPTDEFKLWSHAEQYVQNKIQHREKVFKELLEEGYHKGLIVGRDFTSCKIALEDFYGKEDKRWDLVSGVAKRRLIEKAIEHYNAIHSQEQEKKKKAMLNANDNAQSFYRLHMTGHQNTIKIEAELHRRSEAMKSELELLSVHRNVPRHASIFETLYKNGDRTEELNHAPKVSRRRARDRSVERLKKISDTEKALKSLREDASPLKALVTGELETSRARDEQEGLRVVSFFFKDLAWKPAQRFEMQLRIMLEEIGCPYNMNMPMRFRRIAPDRSGVIIEMKGPPEKISVTCDLANRAMKDFIVCDSKLTRVWDQDAVEDQLGELTDFLLLQHDSLEAAWTTIRGINASQNSIGVNYDTFQRKVKQMGYTRDLKIAWHALDDGNARVTAASFLRLQDVISYAKEPREKAPPSRTLMSFSEAVFKAFPDLAVAFDAFNVAADGKLTATEFITGSKRMQWTGPAPTVFKELDVRDCGFLRAQEFARLGDVHVRPSIRGGVSLQRAHSKKSLAGLESKMEDKDHDKNEKQDDKHDKRGKALAKGKSKAKAKAKGKAKLRAPGRASTPSRAHSESPQSQKLGSSRHLEEEPESEPKYAQTPKSPKSPAPKRSSAKARPRSAPSRPSR